VSKERTRKPPILATSLNTPMDHTTPTTALDQGAKARALTIDAATTPLPTVKCGSFPTSPLHSLTIALNSYICVNRHISATSPPKRPPQAQCAMQGLGAAPRGAGRGAAKIWASPPKAQNVYPLTPRITGLRIRRL
jgi:hypothetical protein